MARINRVFLRGAVLKPPQVAKSGDQFIYARVYVTVVRSGRGAADRDGADQKILLLQELRHQDPDPRRHHVYQPDLLRKDLPS